MIRRWTSPIVAAALLTALVGTAAAQQRSAECSGLKYSNFRLNSAKLYLDNAARFQRTDPQRSVAELGHALQQVTEAVRMGGGDQMTQWFFFGEIALMRGDLVGADSMFTHAEARTDSTCRREMVRLRRNEWAPLVNGAINQLAANNQDSAVSLLRRSTIIFRESPVAYLRLAAIFAGRDQTDSAIAYFKIAGRSGDTPREQEFRLAALFSAARLQQGLERWADAEATFRDYRRLAPQDLAGVAGFGGVLAAQNKTAEADAVLDTLRMLSDTVTSYDVLFNTATELFRSSRYALAARLYERGLTLNRCDRDGLYNLTNTYLAMRDSSKLFQTAQRLVAADSMNRMSIERLAAAYQLNGNPQRTLATLLRRDSLPWTFEATRFDPADTSATVAGVVGNQLPRTHPAFTLTIEFLNGACEVVSSAPVSVPELATAGQHRFTVTGRGRGIMAYRYKTN
jgi:tetratricopeptide (TPR) repeat protein